MAFACGYRRYAVQHDRAPDNSTAAFVSLCHSTSHSGIRATARVPGSLVQAAITYPSSENMNRRGSARVLARLFTETACYQCFPMVGLKLLVTSFECFGGCRFTAAANAVHSARKISSAETAANSRPADADDSKPGRHSHDRASR
jgi:hypothetical protein